MLKHLRAIIRLKLMILCTFMLTPVHLIGLLSAAFSWKMRLGWRIRISRLWARCMAGIMGMTIRIVGRPPEPPFFLVANHLSYCDIFVLESVAKGFFIAKSEAASWPLLGPVLQLGNTIFIDRARIKDIPRVIGHIRKVLNAGYGVILFPEGYSTKGETLLPFKAPLLEVAASGRFPVSYSSLGYYIGGSRREGAAAVHWYGDMGLMGPLYKLLQRPRFTAVIKFGEQKITESDRKVLAASLWEAVNSGIDYGEFE